VTVIEVHTTTCGHKGSFRKGSRYGIGGEGPASRPDISHGVTYQWFCERCDQYSFAAFPDPAKAERYLAIHQTYSCTAGPPPAAVPVSEVWPSPPAAPETGSGAARIRQTAAEHPPTPTTAVGTTSGHRSPSADQVPCPLVQSADGGPAVMPSPDKTRATEAHTSAAL